MKNNLIKSVGYTWGRNVG